MSNHPATELRQRVQREGLEGFQKYYSLYRAIVTDNNDPDQLGRLQLQIPQIYGEQVHDYWAWGAGMPAGSQIGYFSVPNVGDMVWVMFECGDAEFPVWMFGGYAVGELMDKAKESYPQKTVIRTTSGNQIVFDDANKRIDLEQGDGYGIGIKNGEINLGSTDTAPQPVLLGDTTVALVDSLCQNIIDLCTQIALITVTPTPPVSSPPINAAAFAALASAVSAIKGQLPNTKSQVVRTK
jgi:hypothetical protein